MKLFPIIEVYYNKTILVPINVCMCVSLTHTLCVALSIIDYVCTSARLLSHSLFFCSFFPTLSPSKFNCCIVTQTNNTPTKNHFQNSHFILFMIIFSILDHLVLISIYNHPSHCQSLI